MAYNHGIRCSLPLLTRLYPLSSNFSLFFSSLHSQSADDARYLLSRYDPTLGKPLPERSYADNCELYTPNDPTGNPFRHLWVNTLAIQY